jgi:hypothetical protein
VPLVDLNLDIRESPLPGDVRAFLREADRRIGQFLHDHSTPGFVPSDFRRFYFTLQALAEAHLPSGDLFCEWGSGFGVAACLASMLEFDAYGIEIEEPLVEAAQELAADFSLGVEFVQGSFLPADSESCLEVLAPFCWLSTDESAIEEQLGFELSEFDVVFAYPWPDEERLIEILFERHAHLGAILITYHGEDTFRLRRKVRPRGLHGGA